MKLKRTNKMNFKPHDADNEKEDDDNLRVVFYPEETDASRAIEKMNSILFAQMEFCL